MSLEEELKAERVSHLDTSGFCQAASGSPVREVLNQMRTQKVNVCLIMAGDQLQGIVTDRDVLQKIAPDATTWDQPIDTVMTANPITVTPQTSAADALWLMDDKHIRNLPIVDTNGRITGNMTHQAVISFLAARYPIEVLNRPPHPDQFPRKAEGG